MIATTYRDRIYRRYPEKHVPWKGATGPVYREWARGATAHLRDWLPQDRSSACLDLGCGPGNVLYMLRELGYANTTGVDVCEDWLPVAGQFCSNVTREDARDFLRAHVQKFDLITVFDVIEHLKKDEMLDFLDLAYESLRPGGSLILQTPNAESPWGTMHRYHDLTHELAFDPHSLQHCCELCGFKQFEAREVGPYVHGVKSFVRKLIWLAIRTGLLLWNLAETGSRGSDVYTRIFLARVVRPRI